MAETKVMINTHTNEFYILYNGCLFNEVLSWDYKKLIVEYPNVKNYCRFYCAGSDRLDLVKKIVDGHNLRRPYDNMDECLKI